jgi:hypothetical protein
VRKSHETPTLDFSEYSNKILGFRANIKLHGTDVPQSSKHEEDVNLAPIPSM